MVVVVQVLSNMNVAELVDFVKVSSTNGELPDGHRLMMMMMMMIRIRIILMMMMIVIILMMIMKASQQILTRDHICHKQYKQRLCKIIITRVKVHFVDVF